MEQIARDELWTWTAMCADPKLVGLTPAMVADVTDHLWEHEDIMRLVNEAHPKPRPGGPHSKRHSK